MGKRTDELWDKKIDALLDSKNGLKALERKLGASIAKQGKHADPDKPIVATLVPCYKHPQPEMQNGYNEMVKHSAQDCLVFHGPVTSSSVVHWTRNAMIAELIKSQKPWTHVLFIDDDIVPPPDGLIKLLSHRKDIIAGLCTRRNDPPIPNMRYFDEKEGNFKEIWEWPEGKCIEVGAVGTGFMLITKQALEQVAEAYFRCLYEQKVLEMPKQTATEVMEARLAHFDKTANAFWFRFLPGLNGANEYGEDISFCLIAKLCCDIPTFVDTSVQPEHIGSYGYGIKDFLFHREMAIQQAKADGRYVPVPKVYDESKLKISILCPTRGRPDNIRRLLKSLAETSHAGPELILYTDKDDPAQEEYRRIDLPPEFIGKITWIFGERRTLSECWNECAKIATGDLLMVAADDIVFKTKDWDRMVCDAFEKHPDKMIMVYGDDGFWGKKFGTHPIVHRKWFEALGYITPPYFSADYCDTWLNEIAESLGRRVFLPFVNEHMHPLWGKAEMDATHKEKLERAKLDNVSEKYQQLAPEREADVRKLKAQIEELAVVAG